MLYRPALSNRELNCKPDIAVNSRVRVTWFARKYVFKPVNRSVTIEILSASKFLMIFKVPTFIRFYYHLLSNFNFAEGSFESSFMVLWVVLKYFASLPLIAKICVPTGKIAWS